MIKNMSTLRERKMARVRRNLVAILDAIPEADQLRLGLYSIHAVSEAIALAEEVEGNPSPE
jgi:hypothetical protein